MQLYDMAMKLSYSVDHSSRAFSELKPQPVTTQNEVEWIGPGLKLECVVTVHMFSLENLLIHCRRSLLHR